MYEVKSQGAKYGTLNGGEYADTRTIAAAIRADIKAAVKAGNLPAGLKVSIRMSRFAGGSSIDAHIVSGYDFSLKRPVDPSKQEDARYEAYHMTERPNEPAEELAKKVKRYLNAYNQDRSEVQVDYFDVTYYSSVYYAETGGLCWG